MRGVTGIVAVRRERALALAVDDLECEAIQIHP